MATGFEDQYGEDAEVSRLLRERLTRYPAPPRLRIAVMRVLEPELEPRWWSRLWLAPALSAMASAMIMLMWIAPSLPTAAPPDPLQQVARAVVTEHARMLAWGESNPEMVPASLPRVMEESGVVLNWVFTGDDQIQLVNAQPTYVEGHRAMALGYMDADGHAVTYVIMPGAGVALPDRGRVQIDRWRPVVRRDNGFSLIMWKQQGLLCTLVSDLVSERDLGRLKDYFVKVRSSTEPYAVY